MFTPSIGLKGIFTFKSPYSELINNEQEFEIIAIKTIRDLISSGIDPYNTIYVPANLSINDYTNDINKNISLVTLVSNGNEQVTIPVTYITGWPDNTYKKYQGKAITIDLNYLPEKFDLTSLISDVKDLIYDRIGVTTEPKIVNTTPLVYKTEEVDKAIQLLMENKPKVDRSYMTKYYEANAALASIHSEITILKEKINKDTKIYNKLRDDYIDLKNKYDDCCGS